MDNDEQRLKSSMARPYVDFHSFIHSFIQQILRSYIMFRRWMNCTSCQECNREENRPNPGSDVIFTILAEQVHREAL